MDIKHIVGSAVLAMVGIAVLAELFSFSRPAPEPIVIVHTDAPDIEAAIADARLALPEFLHIAANPPRGASDFAVRVRIEDANGAEYAWLSPFGLQPDGGYSGIVSRPPQVATSLEEGDVMRFVADDVTDWMYQWDGKIHGNYTLRAKLPTLPEAEQAQYRERLAPLG